MAFWVEGNDDKYKQFENESRRSMDDSNEILFYTSNNIPSIPYFYVRIVACSGLWTRYWFNKSQAVTEDLCAFVSFSGWDVGCRPFFLEAASGLELGTTKLGHISTLYILFLCHKHGHSCFFFFKWITVSKMFLQRKCKTRSQCFMLVKAHCFIDRWISENIIIQESKSVLSFSYPFY